MQWIVMDSPIDFAVQERLTKQIAMAITEAVQPAGVAVIIEATWVTTVLGLWFKSYFCTMVKGG